MGDGQHKKQFPAGIFSPKMIGIPLHPESQLANNLRASVQSSRQRGSSRPMVWNELGLGKPVEEREQPNCQNGEGLEHREEELE